MAEAPHQQATDAGLGCDWIAVDWGTTHLRAWAMDAGAQALDQASSADGMAGLAQDGFEPALIALIAPWLSSDRCVPVIACGMVGSRQGWVEAAYRATPCTALADETTRPQVADPRIAVHIAPGISQNSPADVMRGEETQIAGFLALNPRFDGVICLPGTHSKWVQVSAGEIVSFQTFMTGEMFATLSRHTVLRHSVTEGWDDAAFDAALSDALSRPERLAARLFTLRADGLLHGQPGGVARAKLSGALIGAELAAAKPYWLGMNIALIGAPDLCATYARALNTQGATPVTLDSAPMTRAGLAAIRKQIEDMP
ncbi:2-dehydro-3-deoxygalactonokinase [Roseicitreum antarcticum]|uniref:2-dehydro-3-deoxygalactonokinase n=1 Tax=Roseicitreum antarcticum TaxID=564137 RepID=A0A1H2Z8F8_9RHOB|nr:2-dehydro-3-deoxygalactonokinase [Roseicitreum antarcticum]SDX13690.1 2-dehydro-3-deoxygalactonokinase [Roseicitreum antarcticum]